MKRPKLKFTKAPDRLGDSLGLAQQCWHMADAACQALGLNFQDASPAEIFERIADLRRPLKAESPS